MPFCSVSDCKYRTTRSSSIRVFQLPPGTTPFLVNQKRLWQHAIREANGGAETLRVNLHVCAAHFISGEASSDFESPDFVPSVFPCKQERKTCGQKIKTCSKAFKSRPHKSETCSPEPMTRSQESENRTPESQTHTPERQTRSQERKTHTPEHMTRAPENENCTPESKNRTPERKTRTPQSKTHTPLRKTCSQAGKSYTRGIQTRSQESKIRIQQRENRRRKKNCIFGSRKRRHRSKTEESPLDLQPSALREAQNELSEEEEEQTPLSSSVLKEGETLTDAEKVSFRSQTTSGLNGIPPPLPADITALLKRHPVVRLKRLVVPTTEFRCELCSETFTSSPLLAKHKEVHDENSHFICEICGMSFTVQEEFTAHQSNHPKLEPYFPCNMCNRSFSTIRHLKRHKLLHVKDGRKCLKCGTLFCQRHNHVLYLPQPKAKSEFEGKSEEEEAAGEESQKVDCDLMKKKDSPVKTEPSRVTETPASSKKVRLIRPATNSPVVTVSMIPVLGVFQKSRMASASPPHIEILPQFSLKTTEPSPLPRPPPVLLLPLLPPSPAPPPPPLLLPTPPPPPHSLLPPMLKYPSDDIHPAVHPKIEEPDPPAAEEPFVPQCSDFPPSLKMFSPQYLTSALLEVKRNYESIFNKPKRFKGVMKKEESDPPGMRRRVAYDLEVVL